MVRLDEEVEMESMHNLKALRTNQAGDKKKICGKYSPNAKPYTQTPRETDDDSSGEGNENESGSEENNKPTTTQTPTKIIRYNKDGTPTRQVGRPSLNKHKKGSKNKNSDESSDSDEESFARDLKDRKVLEALEKASNIEIRERLDQERINRNFFHRSRKEWKEQQAIMQAFCETNLFDPPPLPPSFKLSECENIDDTLYLSLSSVEVPGFSIVNPFIPYNPELSRKFNEQYKAGYIQMYDNEPHHHHHHHHNHHDVSASPRVGENGKGKNSISEKEGRMNFSKRVAELFNPNEWCSEESTLFEELLYIYGTRFDEISRLMCGSKSASQLESHFINKWSSVKDFVSQESQRKNTCHLCFELVDTKPKKGPKAAKDKLVVCGGCERAYHVMCLNPRPIYTTEQWFCSEECVSMSLLQCQLCGNAENDEHMLLCDTCDRGYHMFCLKPPIKEIPEGDWNCPQCLDPTSAKPSVEDIKRLSGDQDPQICTHTPHQFITTINSGGVPRAFKTPNTKFLEPTPSVTLPDNAHLTNTPRSNSAPAIFATTPDKLLKAESTETKITEPIEPNVPTRGSPIEPVKEETDTGDKADEAIEEPKIEIKIEDEENTKMEDINTEFNGEEIKPENTKTEKEVDDSEYFIPPPPPLPKMTRSRSNSKSTPTPTKAPNPPTPPKATPPQSPSTPRKSPSLNRTLSSPHSALKIALPKFSYDASSEGEEDDCMQLDSSTIASSALPHSLLAIKHWGKEMCIECLLSRGLLPGDVVFNNRHVPGAINSTKVEESIFAHPLISHNFNYKASTITKRFDGLLKAVRDATQLVLDGKNDSNNHTHIPPSTTLSTTSTSSTSSPSGSTSVNSTSTSTATTTTTTTSTSTTSTPTSTTPTSFCSSTSAVSITSTSTTSIIPTTPKTPRTPKTPSAPSTPSTPSITPKSRKRSASSTSDGPNKVAKTDPLANLSNPPPVALGDLTRGTWWAFTFNPRLRELADVKANSQLEWQVAHMFVDKIKKGDRVYVWVTGKLHGLYAVGTILTEPFSSISGASPDRTRIHVDELMPNALHKEIIEQDECLRTLSFIRGPPNQQIYALSSKYVESFAKLLSNFFSLKPPPDSSSMPNGNKAVNLVPSPSSSPSVTTPVKPNGLPLSSSSPSILPPPSLKTVQNSVISPTTHPQSPSDVSLSPTFSISAEVFTSIAPVSKIITTASLASPSASSLPTSSSSFPLSSDVHKCYECKRTEREVNSQCKGCKDWYHSACTTYNTGSSLPFYCPPCLTLTQQTQSCAECTNPISTNNPILSCDSCSKCFHYSCGMKTPVAEHSSPSYPLIPRCWLCSSCMPSAMEQTNALLFIGWNELKHECSRIMTSQCEYSYDVLRKVISSSKSQTRVHSRIQELSFHLMELRQAIVAMAQARYGIWASATVLDTSPSL